MISYEFIWFINSEVCVNNFNDLLVLGVDEVINSVEKVYLIVDVMSVFIYEFYLVNVVIFIDIDKLYVVVYVN